MFGSKYIMISKSTVYKIIVMFQKIACKDWKIILSKNYCQSLLIIFAIASLSKSSVKFTQTTKATLRTGFYSFS